MEICDGEMCRPFLGIRKAKTHPNPVFFIVAAPYPLSPRITACFKTSDFRPDRETGVCRKPKTERRGYGDKMALGDKHARVERRTRRFGTAVLSGPSTYVLPSKNGSPVSLIAFLQTVQHTRAYWRCRRLIRICN